MNLHNKEKLSRNIVEYPELNIINKIDEIIKSNKIYNDDNFSKESSLIYKNNYINNNNDFYNFLDIKWENLNNKNNKIFSKDFKKCILNINNNSLSNLNNCLNLMKEKPELILRLIEFDNFNNSKIYGVWMNTDNNWRLIPLDNNFPMIFKNDKYYLAFSETNDNSIWNILIEKALAKSWGSYYEITKKSVHELLYILTGINSYNFKLTNNNINFNKIKEAINNKKIVSAYKTSKFTKGIINDLKFNYHYLVFEIFDKDEDMKGLKIKKEIELSNYKSIFYTYEEENICWMNWEEFLEEFEYISILDNNLKYINNFKIDNKNYSLSKLFIFQKTTLELNLCQSSYLNDEINYGIQNWTHIQEDKLIDLSIIKQNYKTESLNFIRCRKEEKLEELSNHKITLVKLSSEYFFEYILDYSFNNKIHTMNLNLNKGEYLILIESNWDNLNLLNSLSIQINSKYILEIQNINPMNKKLKNIIKKSYYYKYFKDENSKILVNTFKFNGFNIDLFKLINEEDKYIYFFQINENLYVKIKFKIINDLKKSKEKSEEVSLNKFGLITLKDPNEKIKLKGFEFWDEEEFNNDFKNLYDINKYRDYSKNFYLIQDNTEEGCNLCKIY